MKRWMGVAVLALVTAVTGLMLYSQGSKPPVTAMPQATAFRILFGLTDKQPADWSGKISVASGKVLRIQGWRFQQNDTADPATGWRVSTRRASPPSGAASGTLGAMLENGVLVSLALDDPAAQVTVEVRQGTFSFRADEIGWMEGKTFLGNRARVDRSPDTLRLTSSIEEQDYPAAAETAGDIWVTYVEFRHGDRASAPPARYLEPPENFGALSRAAGGDQVMLMRFSKTERQWYPPVAVSATRQDVMRAAVAVDGKKRVWVIWSAGVDGNFDLYARYLDGSDWSPRVRLTYDPGPDLNPVAVADPGGRVWIAWQGFRNDNLEILAAALDGDRFTSETTVSFSRASDWDPSIAAAPNGTVAVAWDTYDKGDYDVYFRVLKFDREIHLSEPVVVAASQKFEARASSAFDPQNRLWIAYEGSEIKWGKDFGAYETTGIALYQGHTLKVKCFEGTRALETTDDVQNVLYATPSAGSWGNGRKGQPPGANAPWPDPSRAEQRKPNGGPGAPQLPRNSFPRIATDADGKVYLVFRTTTGVRQGPGTVWVEAMVYFDGARWQGPVVIPNTDNIMDNRPALAAAGAGRLMVISAMDHRQSPASSGAARGADPVHNDLFAAELRLDARQQTPRLDNSAATPEKPSQETLAEAETIGGMRRYRINVGGETLRLLRGEFHRHTEISGDGGGDGPLIDAYRYLIDAASMDWGGCCDHDNGGGREYFWWFQQKLTDAYHLGERYVPMFSYERSVTYPEGHRNVVFPKRGVRPLPRLPKMADDSPPAPAPDTQMLYRYLEEFGGIAASHTSGTDMGTDWRDNDPILEPVVEIYQGDRQNYEMPEAPRSNSEKDSIGGWRPLGFVSLALQKGYRLGFQSSSDHVSTHMSYCNLWVKEPTREAIMEAFHKRRVYGATDNILADVRSAGHLMGEEFSVSEPPTIEVRVEGTAPFARINVIKDGRYVYTVEPGTKVVGFDWTDNAALKGKTSYYYVRGEQTDGELFWASPMWIKWGQ